MRIQLAYFHFHLLLLLRLPLIVVAGLSYISPSSRPLELPELVLVDAQSNGQSNDLLLLADTQWSLLSDSLARV